MNATCTYITCSHWQLTTFVCVSAVIVQEPIPNNQKSLSYIKKEDIRLDTFANFSWNEGMPMSVAQWLRQFCPPSLWSIRELLHSYTIHDIPKFNWTSGLANNVLKVYRLYSNRLKLKLFNHCRACLSLLDIILSFHSHFMANWIHKKL